jgi:hypothetical protein
MRYVIAYRNKFYASKQDEDGQYWGRLRTATRYLTRATAQKVKQEFWEHEPNVVIYTEEEAQVAEIMQS